MKTKTNNCTTSYAQRAAELGINRGSFDQGFKGDGFSDRFERPEAVESAAAAPPELTEDLSHLNPKKSRFRHKIRNLVAAPEERGELSRDGAAATALAGVVSKWVDVTPDIASSWLTRNARNRPCTEDTVRAYARDMKSGNWVTTHQGIAFNDRDELIDGQHRLAAIIMAGVTVQMMVTFGLPSTVEGKQATTMDNVDRGKPRSVAHQLALQHGIQEPAIVAAVVAQLGSLCFGERTRRLTVGQTLEIYELFKASIHYVIENRSKEHGLRAAGVLAGFIIAHAAWRLRPADRIERMFAALRHGEGIAPGSALEKLRKFLVSDEAQLFTRGSDRSLTELVLQALYLDITGKPCAKLAMVQDGANHFRALLPVHVAKVTKLFELPAADSAFK